MPPLLKPTTFDASDGLKQSSGLSHGAAFNIASQACSGLSWNITNAHLPEKQKVVQYTSSTTRTRQTATTPEARPPCLERTRPTQQVDQSNPLSHQEASRAKTIKKIDTFNLIGHESPTL